MLRIWGMPWPHLCKHCRSSRRTTCLASRSTQRRLLQAFYGLRSKRLLEPPHYTLLLQWLVGLSPDDAIWHPTTFTPTSAVGRSSRSHENRDRLPNDDVMGLFLETLWGPQRSNPCSSTTARGLVCLQTLHTVCQVDDGAPA